MKRIIGISLIILIFFIPSYPSYQAFENDYDFLRKGIISTKTTDYLLSNNYTIKTIIEGKLIKISGFTIEGYPFYSYHRMVDDVVKITGKIIVKENLTPIIQTIGKTVSNQEISSRDLIMVVNQPRLTYSQDVYKIIVKTFDGKINPDPELNDIDGVLPGIKIFIDISDENRLTFKSLQGVSNDEGIFQYGFLVVAHEAKPGKYFVNVKATDGISEINQQFETFIETGRLYVD